jgi:hypothetical protein
MTIGQLCGLIGATLKQASEARWRACCASETCVLLGASAGRSRLDSGDAVAIFAEKIPDTPARRI